LIVVRRSGDILAVIDKLESSLGWWKAMKGNRLGYIPKVGRQAAETGSRDFCHVFLHI